MLCLRNLFLVNLWQAIDVVVVALDAEVLCEVDNLHIGRDGMLLQKLFALAVTEAEEDHVNILKRHRIGESQIGFPDQSFMHVADEQLQKKFFLVL